MSPAMSAGPAVDRPGRATRSTEALAAALAGGGRPGRQRSTSPTATAADFGDPAGRRAASMPPRHGDRRASWRGGAKAREKERHFRGVRGRTGWGGGFARRPRNNSGRLRRAGAGTSPLPDFGGPRGSGGFGRSEESTGARGNALRVQVCTATGQRRDADWNSIRRGSPVPADRSNSHLFWRRIPLRCWAFPLARNAAAAASTVRAGRLRRWR